jgi:hypothetical protein
MYRKISKHFVRQLFDYAPASDNVTATKTVTASLKESYSSGEMLSAKVIRKDEHVP